MKNLFTTFSLIFIFFITFGGPHLWGQASLPLTRTTWNAGAPTGWTDHNTGFYGTSFACSGYNMGQFDATGDYYQVHFGSAPFQLSYNLKRTTNAGSSSCLVQQSTDGINWISIVNHTVLPTSCTQSIHSLNASTRYIRWTFTDGGPNLGLDDVVISQSQTNLYFQDFEGSLNLPTNWIQSSNGSNIFVTNSLSGNDRCFGAGQVNNNLLAQNCIPSGEERSFQVMNIQTTGFSGIYISFCHRKTGCFIPPVILEWSNDLGSNWNGISYSAPSTSSEWASFTSATLPSGAENQASLWFRWRYTTDQGPDPNCQAAFQSCTGDTPGNFRIDDFGVWANFVLPVELTHFNAKESQKKVELFWQTSSETNSDYFQLEHSINGRDFKSLGQAEAAGFSTETRNYQFTHQSPENGVNYYRLNQVDFDGSSTLSRIVSVQIGRLGKSILYPTLAQSSIHLVFTEETSETSLLYLFDATGRLMQEHQVDSGVTEHEIDIEALTPGTYFLKVQSGRTFETLRFIRQ